MKYDIRVWLVAVILSLPLVANAGRPEQPKLIGLVEIPSLYDQQLTNRASHLSVVVRAAPTLDSATLGAIGHSENLETHEWSYEQPAAAVYGYRHDGRIAWYQLRMMPSGQLGWLDANAETVFHPLSSLITESLSYLTDAWDSRVYGTAGQEATATRLGAGGPEVPVAVAGSAIVEKTLWFLVVVLKESPCASSDAPGVLDAGWIPAHSPTGKLNVWFYSRGC